ncbi:hypothetical protein QE152_g36493 [Popillia japonica]|uniref:Uncharacterized protein n=1 Tax=Popillia japonica TaxID=7064 RepID=A0AAW1IDF5_POPJA
MVATDAINTSFSQIISGLVSVNQTKKVKRTKKISVPAGKGIRPDDLSQETTPEPQAQARSKGKKRIVDVPSTSRSNDENSSVEVEDLFEEDDPNLTVANKTSNQENVDEEQPSAFMAQLATNEFVIVSFTYNESLKKETSKKFVAQIDKIGKKAITVSCMRSYNGQANVFVFPNVPDKCDIQPKQIECIIGPPTYQH